MLACYRRLDVTSLRGGAYRDVARQSVKINRTAMNGVILYTAVLLFFATAPVKAIEDKYLDANGVKIRFIDTGRDQI